MFSMSLLRRLFPLWVFLIVAGAGVYLTWLNLQLTNQQRSLTMQQLGSAEVNLIERRINRALSASYILGQDVVRHQGFVFDFNQLAAGILGYIPELSSLQFARGSTITDIYPLSGNELAIGKNLVKIETGAMGFSPSQLLANEHQAGIIGPLTLVQGGVAVIARNPVYLPRGQGKDEFWGYASAVIALSNVIVESELQDLLLQGFNYGIYARHPGADHRPTLVSGKPVDDALPHVLKLDMRVPGQSWYLLLEYDESTGMRHWIGYLLSVLIALILASLTLYISREPERLRRLVHQKTQELEHQANFDGLTGLANRRKLESSLSECLELQRQSGDQAALLYLDLDEFKRINDSLDHRWGDRLLREVATRMQLLLRNRALIARLGGDEFAILLWHVLDREQVLERAAELLEAIRKPVELRNRQVTVTASIGIAMIPGDGDTEIQLQRHADLALYEAKRQGKNRFSFYESVLQQHANHRARIEEALRLGIERGELRMHLQPVCCLQTRELCKAEALVRWQHPQRGLLFPGEFIDVAETTGLIIPLGYWIFREACRFIAARAQSGEQIIPIAVNVSATQLKEPDMVEQLQLILQQTGAPASSLILEITESLIMDDIEHAVRLLEQCRQLGLKIAIDDFGTGYSSLAQLKKLPVDTLKVDRSFVQDLATDPDDQKITAAIIAMAHTLELDVVAEGIETEEELALLMSYGCDLGQGYLFGRPAEPIDSEVPMVRASSSLPL
ncbi:EAL domain-containing protein [Pokkaliibacter sp. CJK22405]|uniref:bifunctional diguanylate cyclase/phosphodiesterase n=1 Tax=Pokkaliibacter sp. CJK22405 TaxID=3384615 RepID=UPI0039848202